MLNITIFSSEEGSVVEYDEHTGNPREVRQTETTIEGVPLYDEAFFINNDLKLSVEQLNGKIILYSTTNLYDDEGEPIEIIYLVPDGELAQVSIPKLRILVENKMNEAIE